MSEYQDPPAVAAAPLSPHRSRSFLTRIEDKAATDGYEHAAALRPVNSRGHARYGELADSASERQHKVSEGILILMVECLSELLKASA